MENKKVLTLCVIYKGSRVLLGMKKRGFGQGRWNGFGGKIHEGETIEAAAKREVLEESGVNILDMEKMGIIEFEFQGNPEILEVNIFRAENFSGNPIETEEMKPQWFDVKEIPFEEMWSDDRYWLPLLLAGKKFKGKFLFDNNDKVLEYKLFEE
jgi:8-oxo-dGTP diphosphatase / 2-hydroxy-dATP diphosphatase